MQFIPIEKTANQSFTGNIGDYRYDFTFREDDGFMSYDISIDETIICSGFPFVIGQLMLPYKYMESDGNFIIVTDSDTEVDYKAFGDTQFLAYVTAEEAEDFRSVL